MRSGCLRCLTRVCYFKAEWTGAKGFEMSMKVVVIGGGAAGFFAALSCKQHHPEYAVTIFEKSDKLLAKVAVSGGGRCNLTHACFDNRALSQSYPRGARQLNKSFFQFNAQDTIAWFEKRGVTLKTESDNRVFPVSDNSQTIIDCLVREANKLGVVIQKGVAISEINKNRNGFMLTSNGGETTADKIIVASGGSPKLTGFDWLQKLGHAIIPPVPSLFTFNMPNEPIRKLMGVVANRCLLRIKGVKTEKGRSLPESVGPLLITHWGMSGPAVLKLSSWCARELHAVDYRFEVLVNWLGDKNEQQIRDQLATASFGMGKRHLGNANPFQLPSRCWLFLLEKNEIDSTIRWNQLSKKSQNKLLSTLTNDAYKVEGKTTFKEEFVTCGGVALDEIYFDTMESKICPGLYFAGEVLDIDAVTGGFNFQAAWTTGFIAGKLGKDK